MEGAGLEGIVRSSLLDTILRCLADFQNKRVRRQVSTRVQGRALNWDCKWEDCHCVGDRVDGGKKGQRTELSNGKRPGR